MPFSLLEFFEQIHLLIKENIVINVNAALNIFNIFNTNYKKTVIMTILYATVIDYKKIDDSNDNKIL